MKIKIHVFNKNMSYRIINTEKRMIDFDIFISNLKSYLRLFNFHNVYNYNINSKHTIICSDEYIIECIDKESDTFNIICVLTKCNCSTLSSNYYIKLEHFFNKFSK